MRIYTRENPVVLENTGKDGESFSLNVFPSSTSTMVGFQLVFPKDCVVERFSENSIIIRCKRPHEEEG